MTATLQMPSVRGELGGDHAARAHADDDEVVLVRDARHGTLGRRLVEHEPGRSSGTVRVRRRHQRRATVRAFLKEFKEFISAGNLIELAVAFILGLAIKAVIDAFIHERRQPDHRCDRRQAEPRQRAAVHSHATTVEGTETDDSVLSIGVVLTQIVSLILVGLVLFLMIKAYNKMRRKRRRRSRPGRATTSCSPRSATSLRARLTSSRRRCAAAGPAIRWPDSMRSTCQSSHEKSPPRRRRPGSRSRSPRARPPRPARPRSRGRARSGDRRRRRVLPTARRHRPPSAGDAPRPTTPRQRPTRRTRTPVETTDAAAATSTSDGHRGRRGVHDEHARAATRRRRSPPPTAAHDVGEQRHGQPGADDRRLDPRLDGAPLRQQHVPRARPPRLAGRGRGRGEPRDHVRQQGAAQPDERRMGRRGDPARQQLRAEAELVHGRARQDARRAAAAAGAAAHRHGVRARRSAR